MMDAKKILFYDIETSPMQVWTFRIGNKVSIPHSAIVQGSKTDIICVAWKWAHEKETHSLDWGWDKQSSKAMISAFDKVINEADIVIGHNADQFDWRHLNTQRMLNGLPAINWGTKSEDTLKQIRRHFYLPSYKLDYVADLLGVGNKSPMTFSDWVDISTKKDKSKLDKMIKYCKKDVQLLQKVYNVIKPYVRPKMRASDVLHSCTVCGSTDLKKNGTNTYNGKTRQSFICRSHGGYAGSALVNTAGKVATIQ
jgi:DNA polymerase elongation subunit (family B)